MLRVIIASLIIFSLKSVLTLNILALLPYEGRSHFLVFEKYLEKLAERGHNLTVVSYYPRKDINSNYHDINLAEKIKITETVLPIERSYFNLLKIMDFVVQSGTKNCKAMLENESVQDLWKSKRKFDVIVLEHFNSDCALGLAYKLEAPIVGLTSCALTPWQHRTFGIPFNPSYVPFILTGGFQPSIFERIEKAVLDFTFNFKYSNGRRIDQETLGKYFDDMPPLEEVGRKMKFLLLYQHFSISGSRLLPPNVVEVGGYHVVPSKPLPDDLQNFVNKSEHGVIYISFGSMLKESSLPKHKLDAILDALAELPQSVIWKWRGNDFPRYSENIFVSKWLPQNDLLAHPKIKAFFSHCGYLSTTEAVHHGVPMVAMPVIGDQPLNAESIERSGLGVQIALNELTKENLLEKFRIVLRSGFRSKVKNLSRIYRKRPITAMDSAIFWTELAAHHNVTFTNHAVDVPMYQYMCLDIILIVALLIGSCFFIMLILTRKLLMFVVKNLGVDLKPKRN